MANEQNLIPFKPGPDPRRGVKPKGAKHISTWIQELLDDEEFGVQLVYGDRGLIDYKGAPLKAIIMASIHKAVTGDAAAREWLAKYGYGQKLELSVDDPVKLLLDKFGITEEVESGRKDDGAVQDSSKSNT